MMAHPNVLITSVAAKVLLVRAFRDALADEGQVFTCDARQQCAGGLASDGHHAVLPLADPAALHQLLELCDRKEIGLLVPTRDGELSFLAEHAESFRAIGTHVLVPALEDLRRCQDKRAFTLHLQANRLPSIPIVSARDATLPAFIRPLRGAAGAGARRIDTRAEIDALRDGDDVLVHPMIMAPEYSIDLLMHPVSRKAVQAVCRERVQIVGGESKISRVIDHPRLAELSGQLGEAFGLVGHNTVQAFDDAERGVLFIEVNPRFGGASNLSIQAGLDSPARILAMLRDEVEPIEPRPIRFGTTMYRYSDDFIVQE